MRPKGFRPGVKYRSRYGRYRLVLKGDVVMMTTDGKSIFVSGNQDDVPGTILFENYEYTPKNKETYDAMAKAWNKNWGGIPDEALTIHDSQIETPKGLSQRDAEIFAEGVQRRQSEGKMLPHPGVAYWEVGPELTNLVNPPEKERPQGHAGARTTGMGIR